MTRNNTPWRPLTTAEIDWTNDDSPRSSLFKDVYYSSSNGLDESEYVYLGGNKLPDRWGSHPHASFCVVETGFGTGLNFLATWRMWRNQDGPCPRLHYVSIEKYPLRTEDMRKVLEAWPALSAYSAALLDAYPEPIPGQHRIVLEDGAVILDLWLEDIAEAIENLAGYGSKNVDAWYLDGFAPGRNPQMWTAKLFETMAAASRKNATFATFTAAGHVRRNLAKAGFQVNKSPGFGRKRECLSGQLADSFTDEPIQLTITPWDLRSDSDTPPRPLTALIIGAGVAGCTAAAALAKRGIFVHVVESGQVAGAGSGNDQGVLYTRLSQKHSPLGDFSLQSFSFAHRFYQQLLSAGKLRKGIDGDICGSFHQNDDLEELAAMKLQLQSVPDLARVLDAGQANALLGITQMKDGYWYPNSGWMRPASICHALLDDANIQLTENAGMISLEKTDRGWTALANSPSGEPRVLAQADCAVIAAGTQAGTLADLEWLPLQAIRGQTSTLATTADFSALRAALCHRGYISPARKGSHCIGATFDLRDSDVQTRPADHRRNLDTLASAVPDWQVALTDIDDKQMEGRVGYRCASPDYLPLVGPVPDRTLFLQNYASLRKNARQIIASPGSFIPGLYLTTGHGSRGLTSTPLAAETLASIICDEPVPLSRELYRAISPARFIIRDLRRNKV